MLKHSFGCNIRTELAFYQSSECEIKFMTRWLWHLVPKYELRFGLGNNCAIARTLLVYYYYYYYYVCHSWMPKIIVVIMTIMMAMMMIAIVFHKYYYCYNHHHMLCIVDMLNVSAWLAWLGSVGFSSKSKIVLTMYLYVRDDVVTLCIGLYLNLSSSLQSHIRNDILQIWCDFGTLTSLCRHWYDVPFVFVYSAI